MKGKLSIGKVTCCGSPEEDYIRIEIEDEISSIQFVTVKADLETFTRALFGLGNVPIEFELRGAERVGKKYEHKIVQVSIPNAPDGISLLDKDIDQAVGYYEVDGWTGRREDCKNHHRHIRQSNTMRKDRTYQLYAVLYVRWVDAEEGGELNVQ